MFSRNQTLIAVIVALVLSGCGGKTAATNLDDLGHAWTNQASTSLNGLENSKIKVGANLKLGNDAAQSTLTKTYSSAPTPQQQAKMSPEVRAKVEAMFARIYFEQLLMETVDKMVARRSQIAELATAAVNRLPLLADAKTFMATPTGEFILEIACNAAWDHMSTPEQTDARTEVEDTRRLLTTYKDTVLKAPGSTDVEKIATAAQKVYVSRYGGSAVNWGNYAKEVSAKAQSLVQDGAMKILGPDGIAVTVGLVFFASICLRPPS